jgi:hypothetical protein
MNIIRTRALADLYWHSNAEKTFRRFKPYRRRSILQNAFEKHWRQAQAERAPS